MALHTYSKQHHWAKPATIGFLGATTPSAWSAFVSAFEQRLHDAGWINGHNIEIDYRWAEGRHDRYDKIAKDLVGRGVDIIVTSGTPAVIAAKKATKKIPIVFAAAGDPVRSGLVGSLAHPGGNVTGMSNRQTDLAARRLDELHKALPRLKRLAIVGNRANHVIRLEIEQLEKRARPLKIEIVRRDIRHAAQIAPVIKRLRGKVDAIYVCTDPLLTRHMISLNILAASAKLPTMHAFRNYVEAGGLLSYGPDFRHHFQNAADLTDQILRGKNPGTIPVKQNKRCELVINLNTARALGLSIPKGVRRRAEAVQ